MPGPVSLTARVGDPSARVTRTVIVTGVSVSVLAASAGETKPAMRP